MIASFCVEDFKKALNQLGNVVKPNTAIPVLGYVRVVAKENGVTVQGTNHQTYYTLAVQGTVKESEGEILLPVSETKSMLIKLNPHDEVTFNSDGAELLITSGTSTWRRPVRSSVDMPTFPELTEDMYQTLPAHRLGDLLSAAMRAAPKKQTFNPGITQLHFDNGFISSGDGLWFQRVEAAEVAHVTTTIPLDGAKTLLSVLRAWENVPIQFGHNDKHIVIRSADEVIGITRLALEFPDISVYLDTPKVTHADELSVLSKDLVTALGQVGLSADVETGTISIELDNPSKMRLFTKTFEGSAETYVSCHWEGAPRTLSVDWRAVKGAVQACGNPEKFIIRLGPDARRNPSTLYIEHNGVSAAIVQQRTLR